MERFISDPKSTRRLIHSGRVCPRVRIENLNELINDNSKIKDDLENTNTFIGAVQKYESNLPQLQAIIAERIFGLTRENLPPSQSLSLYIIDEEPYEINDSIGQIFPFIRGEYKITPDFKLLNPRNGVYSVSAFHEGSSTIATEIGRKSRTFLAPPDEEFIVYDGFDEVEDDLFPGEITIEITRDRYIIKAPSLTVDASYDSRVYNYLFFMPRKIIHYVFENDSSLRTKTTHPFAFSGAGVYTKLYVSSSNISFFTNILGQYQDRVTEELTEVTVSERAVYLTHAHHLDINLKIGEDLAEKLYDYGLKQLSNQDVLTDSILDVFNQSVINTNAITQLRDSTYLVREAELVTDDFYAGEDGKDYIINKNYVVNYLVDPLDVLRIDLKDVPSSLFTQNIESIEDIYSVPGDINFDVYVTRRPRTDHVNFTYNNKYFYDPPNLKLNVDRYQSRSVFDGDITLSLIARGTSDPDSSIAVMESGYVDITINNEIFSGEITWGNPVFAGRDFTMLGDFSFFVPDLYITTWRGASNDTTTFSDDDEQVIQSTPLSFKTTNDYAQGGDISVYNVSITEEKLIDDDYVISDNYKSKPLVHFVRNPRFEYVSLPIRGKKPVYASQFKQNFELLKINIKQLITNYKIGNIQDNIDALNRMSEPNFLSLVSNVTLTAAQFVPESKLLSNLLIFGSAAQVGEEIFQGKLGMAISTGLGIGFSRNRNKHGSKAPVEARNDIIGMFDKHLKSYTKDTEQNNRLKRFNSHQNTQEDIVKIQSEARTHPIDSSTDGETVIMLRAAPIDGSGKALQIHDKLSKIPGFRRLSQKILGEYDRPEHKGITIKTSFAVEDDPFGARVDFTLNQGINEGVQRYDGSFQLGPIKFNKTPSNPGFHGLFTVEKNKTPQLLSFDMLGVTDEAKLSKERKALLYMKGAPPTEIQDLTLDGLYQYDTRDNDSLARSVHVDLNNTSFRTERSTQCAIDVNSVNDYLLDWTTGPSLRNYEYDLLNNNCWGFANETYNTLTYGIHSKRTRDIYNNFTHKQPEYVINQTTLANQVERFYDSVIRSALGLSSPNRTKLLDVFSLK